MIIRFGKYKGRTVKWVMYNDRRYFAWAQQNAPAMFEEFKPAGKPHSEPPVGETPKYDEVPEEEDGAKDSWSNPHEFFKIAQRARSLGLDL
jgi:hypothetical protein